MLGDAGIEGGGESVRWDVAGNGGRAGEQALDIVDFPGAGPQFLESVGELRLAGEEHVPPGGFVAAEQGGELGLDFGGIGDAGGPLGLEAGGGSGTPGFLEGPDLAVGFEFQRDANMIAAGLGIPAAHGVPQGGGGRDMDVK